MPKNKFGGNKAKKSKNYYEERTFILKEEDQDYALVTKVFGGCRVEISCNDGINRIGHIRGKMRKKIWINVGDTVLISLRDYQDNKADIIHKYLPDEVAKLMDLNQIVKTEVKETDCSFSFEEI